MPDLSLNPDAPVNRPGKGRPASASSGQRVGHALINHTSEPCRYLVVGNPHPHDVAVHTDTGRVSVKLAGESYRRSATMEYWEGVDVDGQP
jgi:uncharacterized cupin superfamily protein